MGLMNKLGSAVGGNIMQGVLGNMSEVDATTLEKEYGAYLMEGETIQTGFKLVRDALIITDKRILDFDKQGATGQKMWILSISARFTMLLLRRQASAWMTVNFPLITSRLRT